jgi:transposase
VIDRKGRPLRFLLSGGQCFDGKAAVPLLKPLPPPKKLLADKAYDCAAFRDWLSRRGTTPVIAANLILKSQQSLHDWDDL